VFSVGIEEIDRQHKKLVSLIAELHEAMKEGRGAAALNRILGDLVTYTRVHFDSEERLMEKHGYPALDAHKREHAALSRKVSDYVEQVRSGAVSLTPEVLGFLKDWLVNHILHTDKNYGPFLAARGVH
jgi:hemerythrin-like metal-binding protein